MASDNMTAKGDRVGMRQEAIINKFTYLRLSTRSWSASPVNVSLYTLQV